VGAWKWKFKVDREMGGKKEDTGSRPEDQTEVGRELGKVKNGRLDRQPSNETEKRLDLFDKNGKPAGRNSKKGEK